MNRVMVIGRSGAGKTTLLKALGSGVEVARKTQMVEFHNWSVDTPGEYAETPRFYTYLISTAMKAAVILVVQDAPAPRATLPPMFCQVFGKKHVIGVVTKIDRADAQPERAEEHLKQQGVKGPYFRVSAVTGEGIDALRSHIEELLGGGLQA